MKCAYKTVRCVIVTSIDVSVAENAWQNSSFLSITDGQTNIIKQSSDVLV